MSLNTINYFLVLLYMLTFILSYIGNEEQADRLLLQLKQAGFPNITIINPLPSCEKLGIKPSKIVFYTFKKYILPSLVATKDDCIIFEDDVEVKSPYSLYLEHFNKGLLSRLSYMKKTGKHFIVGANCVGIDKRLIHRLNIAIHKARPQHWDRFLSTFGYSLDEGEHYVIEKEKRLGGTTTHYSPIIGEIRKGYKTTF